MIFLMLLSHIMQLIYVKENMRSVLIEYQTKVSKQLTGASGSMILLIREIWREQIKTEINQKS